MDGGQWQMFANLVAKYGVMPKSAMPEVNCCSSSRLMNRMLTSKLREYVSTRVREKRRGEERHPVCYVILSICGVLLCVCNMWCVVCDVRALRQREEKRHPVCYVVWGVCDVYYQPCC